MTNREYLETIKIAYDKAVGEYTASGLESFDEWLNQEHHEWKFKVGDFLKRDSFDHYIYVVVGLDNEHMYMKRILRSGKFDTHVSCSNDIPAEWRKHDIYYTTWDERSKFTKIF